MLDIHVITLAYGDAGVHTQQAKNMLNLTLNSCAKYNWKVNIFHAINGYKLDPSIWTCLELKAPQKQSQSGGKFSDKPGAQGCFLSHFLLWKMCVDSNAPMVILEDDVNIIAPLPDIEPKFDLIKLHKPRQIKEHKTVGTWSPGAFGYWLSPTGAQKMIDFVRNNGVKYNDKCIGSKILDWAYIDQPIIKLRQRQGSSTNPEKYPYDRN